MIYLLDTNVVIAILKNDPLRVQQRLADLIRAGDEIARVPDLLWEDWTASR